MRITRSLAALLALVVSTHAAGQEPAPLRWCAYMATGSVLKLATDDAALQKAPELLRNLRVTKVYLEFFRDQPVSNDNIKKVADALAKEGFEIAGGIATLPGENYGVREDAKLGWFNWQNPKTQEDVANVVKTAAPLFKEIIVDDFFCTGDTSAESVAAKGELEWSDYRRALLTQSAISTIIVPAKTANSTCVLIMKFPQWYDRFHEFGYDVPAESALFDRIWVGTETRGAGTQRYGFTQPYMGFNNLRWIASIAGEKTAGAWFDHGDCDANDFVEQAYQSVLAGAKEIMLFAYSDIEPGHPGHELLKKEQDRLATLAAAVQQTPVTGVAAYKPPNTDAGPDLFIMDYIGMLGVPLVPQSLPPVGARVVFLPTQAAGDPNAGMFVRNAIAQRGTIIMTTGFLATAPMRDDLIRLAGLRGSVTLSPMRAVSMRIGGEEHKVAHGIDLAGKLTLGEAKPLLMAADSGGRKTPLLTQHTVQGATIYVLNTRTFSQADYDAVGEVLLPPRPLGILELPQAAVEVIRDAFTAPLGISLDAPARVTLQPLGPGYVMHNYTGSRQTVRLSAPYGAKGGFVDRFTGKAYALEGRQVDVTIGSRSRVWLAPN